MQAVIVARSIAQQQWRRPRLTRLVAPGDIVGMVIRKARCLSQALLPAIGDSSEMGIERGPDCLHGAGQWIGEIAVLAAPEAVPRHHHPAAKTIVPVVE